MITMIKRIIKKQDREMINQIIRRTSYVTSVTERVIFKKTASDTKPLERSLWHAMPATRM